MLKNKSLLKISVIICKIVLFVSLLFPIMYINVSAKTVSIESYSGEFKGYAYGKNSGEIHLLTRLTKPSDDSPAITMLVHGQGGNASHWSNDGDDEFVYDPISLIESLRSPYDNFEVFLADMNSSTEFDLIKITRNSYDKSMCEYIDKLQDVSKHIIVVFQAFSPTSSHKIVYEELHTVIDKLSYDILYLTGKIPKVNLISHSRGGITSMMYASGYRVGSKTDLIQYEIQIEDENEYLAEVNQPDNYIYGDIKNDHPFNVSELYSMGTPYWGTEWDTKFLGIAHKLLGESTFECPSAKNILDETIQEEIYNCWEEAVDKNPKLTLHSIAGTFDLSFVLGLLSEDYESISAYLTPELVSMCLKILDEWGALASLTLTTISAGMAYGTGKLISIPYVGWVFAVPSGVLTITVSAVDVILITAVNKLNEFNDKYFEQLQNGANINQTMYTELSYILKDFIDAFSMFENFMEQFTEETNLVYNWGDLFIDTKSQFADGFSNVVEYEELFQYSDIDYIVNENNDVVVTYSSRSFDYLKSIDNPAIPHNLETRDSDIIEYICDNIEMGTPSSFYEYTYLTNNTVKVTGINIPNYYYDSNGNIKEEYSKIKIDLSSGIEGKAVTVIGDEAFKDETYLDTIIIPNTVIEIGDLAFENCSSLTTINIPSSVTSIGDLAFKNCTSLTDVTINRDNYNITELGISAFDGCSSLNNIHVPSNRIFDYYNAINWKTYKSRITSDVSFEQININCYSNINSTITINPGEKGILKINVNCSNNYIITSSSNNYIIFKLYDSDMNEIDISPTSYNSCSGEINSYLTEGEYYISVEYTHPAVEGEALINIQLSYNNNNSFEYGSNNVLTHLHNVNGELQNSSVYTNYYGRGLYKITINGNLQSYQNVLTIYDNSNKDEPMKRIETSLYELDARTSMVNNNLVVYFNEGYNYYIDIIVPIASYDTLTLSIERIEEPIEVDLVHYEHENDDDPTNDDIIYEHIIMTNETRVGDHFVLLEILEPSSISVIYDYTGTQDEFIYFVLFKEVYNKNESQYEMQLVFPEMMVTYGESLEWKSSITAGRHYIGYFNKLNPNSSISITITR